MNNKETLRQLYYYKAFGYEFAPEIWQNNYVKSSEFENITQISKAIASCSLCSLCKSRNKAVLPIGNGKIFIISSSPTPSEDETGEVFNGRAGELLQDILKELDIEGQIYYSCAIKCKIPIGKNVTEEQISKCLPYILNEISIIKPKIAVALGENTLKILLPQFKQDLNSVLGSIINFQNTPLIPTYSPSWLLTNPSKIQIFKQNLQKAKGFL